MEQKHYLWTAGNSTVSVFLAAGVVTRLREVASANSVAPEIGGILLGRRKSDDCISIEDFELISSEHRRGLIFTLSGADKRRLGQRLRATHRGLQPVGSFRTHRRQGLYMDQYDFDLMSEHFAGSADVMLLIRPTDWQAAFFVWEEGDINRQKSYKEFPFDLTALPLLASEPPVAMPLRRPDAPLAATQGLPTLMKVGLIAATAGLAAVLAFYTHNHRVFNSINGTSPAVSLASNPPEPPQVAVLNPPIFPDTTQLNNQYELHVKVPFRPSPFAKPEDRAEPASPHVRQPQQTAALPQPAPPPELLQPVQTAGNLPLPVVTRAVLQPVRPILVSEVSLEPSQPGVLRRGIHHVPVLNLLDRHKYKSGSDFAPAQPIREVKPRLPEDLQPDIANRPVDVKVWIDDTGQVTKTELLSNPKEPEIADIASNAAYKWTFQPARLSDRPVSSEMVMHFRFVPKPAP